MDVDIHLVIIWDVSNEVIILLSSIIVSIVLCFIGIVIRKPQNLCYVASGILAIAVVIMCVGLDQLSGSNATTYRIWTLLLLVISGILSLILVTKHYAMITLKAGRV
eukprot:235142_1